MSGLCYESVNAQGCVAADCRQRHDIHRCSCGLALLNQNRSQHLQGKRHKKSMDALARIAADRTRFSETNLHDTSHRATHSQERRSYSQFTHCEPCDRDIPSFRWDFHLRQSAHARACRSAESRRIRELASTNQNGVEISGETDALAFGVVEIPASGTSAAQTKAFTVRKISDNLNLKLVDLRLTSAKESTTHTPSFSVIILGSRILREISELSISVKFIPIYAGRHEDILELAFLNLDSQQRFTIIRALSATVGSEEDQEELKPKAPYAKRKFVPMRLDGPVISPLRPPTWSETKWRVALPLYNPPKGLIKAAYGKNGHNIVSRNFMPAVLEQKTHGKHFQNLIWIEEEQRRQDLLLYALENVTLVAQYPKYRLEVEGLAEGRPSVLVGDFILLKHHGTSGEWYKGCVHDISANTVGLRFSDQFSTFKGNRFDVQFVLNRIPLRRQHQALTVKNESSRLVFPDIEHDLSSTINLDDGNPTPPINRTLQDNPEQLMAVSTIVHSPPGSLPFVIFGPPGTGKTVTVVEAILQLLDSDPRVTILACAPSNSAADLLAEKLISVLDSTQLFRLNATSREYKSLPKILEKHSLINGNLIFAVPTLESLERFRVVVSTCISGGIPYGLGARKGHFSHVFIDEAGQCTEPEALIPIKTMADDWTNVILAGDNKQLGPSIRSRVASMLGLNKSYLSRIMEREAYDLQTRIGITIVKLVKNFRSHPDILRFSNEQFYNRELLACGDPVLTHSLLRSEPVKQNFPLVFHGIIGKDQQEASSPSFFNIEEATLVKKYCEELLGDRRLRLQTRDIGVITPYHAQRCKIARILRDKLKGIKVGSVEEFQGQERRVIIMSTVRSSTDYVRYDIKHTLGFVANSRRLNVAITRAQALLIIIGNPTVLSLDPLWRALLNYIYLGGGWRGKSIDWDPKEPLLDAGYDEQIRQHAEGEAKDMISRLKSFIVDNTEDLAFVDEEGGSDAQGEGYLDSAVWREEE